MVVFTTMLTTAGFEVSGNSAADAKPQDLTPVESLPDAAQPALPATDPPGPPSVSPSIGPSTVDAGLLVPPADDDPEHPKRKKRDKVEVLDADLGRVPKGQAKRQIDSLPITFSLGDGEILRRHDKKVPPGQLKDQAKMRISTIADDQRDRLGLSGDGFKVESLEPAGGPVVVRAVIDYSGVAREMSMDWVYRVQLTRVNDCLALAPADIGCAAVDEAAMENDPAAMTLTAEFVIDPSDLGVQPGQVAAPSGVDPAIASAARAAVVAAGGPAVGADTSSTTEGTLGVGTSFRSGYSYRRRSTSSAGSSYGLTGSYGSTFGSYAATPVSSAATWSVGLQSGAFEWSYQVPTVPTTMGAAPAVSLNYSSAGADGVVSDANGQAPMLGFGWDLSVGGYIERSYKPCDADGWTNADQLQHHDLCWYTAPSGQYEFLSLVLNGHSSKMIQVATNEFRLENNPGWRIVRTGSPQAADEYFEVNTPDGTLYTFGKYPAQLNSRWLVPVFGNNAGEPCSGANGGGWCSQGWRWQLDNTVDTNGNIQEYHYVREDNKYAMLGVPAYSLAYARGGYLWYVDYGRNDIAGIGYRARVIFNYMNRCLSSDSAQGCLWVVGNATPWYLDTPTDLVCETAANCANTQAAPSFFTKRALSDIQTQVFSSGTPVSVDTVTLQMEWPDYDGWGGVPAQYWLRQIIRTGQAATYLMPNNISLPPIRFESAFLLNNSGDAGVNIPIWRVSQVNDELGGSTLVSYGQPPAVNPPNLGGNSCVNAGGPSVSPWLNGTYCYARAFGTVWKKYEKFVVTQTVRTDQTTAAGTSQTVQYAYNAPAWGWDDDTLASTFSWDIFRGHDWVTVYEDVNASVTEHRFFRGKNGDFTYGGPPQPVTITYADGTVVADDKWLAGAEFETRAYANGVVEQWNDVRYWPLVTSGIYSGTQATMQIVDVSTSRTHYGATWLTTKTDRTVDGFGNQTSLIDYGNVNTSTDDRCTHTVYDPPTITQGTYGPIWMTDRVQAEAIRLDLSTDVFGNCNATGAQSWTQYAYDGLSIGITPTKGNLTAVWRTKDGGVTWDVTNRSFDLAGRITTVDGPLPGTTDRTTTGFDDSLYSYAKTTTNGLGHVTTVDSIVPGRLSPVQVTDPNLKVTTYGYDGLGRLKQVRTPTEQVWGAPNAVEFDYVTRPTAAGGSPQPYNPSYVKTSVAQDNAGTRLESWVYSNGLGQAVQSQRPGPNGNGRILNTSIFDGRGLAVRQTDSYFEASAAGTGFTMSGILGAREARVAYDGLGRPISSQRFYNGAVALPATTISYSGWATTVTPPVDSAQPTMQIHGGRGELTQVRRYKTATTYAATNYTYDHVGNLTQVADPANKLTTMTYDWFGRVKTVNDPDEGLTQTTYDEANNPISVTNAKGETIQTQFDGLGRPTQRTGPGGVLRAQWAYDAPLEKGLLDKTTAYQGNVVSMITDILQYDARDRPNATRYDVKSIPGFTDNGLAGIYDFTYGYDAANHQTSVVYPATASSWSEYVATAYTSQGFASTLTGYYGDHYVNSTGYNDDGTLKNRVLGATTTPVTRTYSWENATGRLIGLRATQPGSVVDQDLTYTYKSAGDLRSITDAVAGERQCFDYDAWQRLTLAYTASTGVSCDAVVGAIVGPAPYNHRYSYDNINNLTTFGPYDPANTAVGSNAYTYGSSKPHAVTSITTPTGTDAYTYDATGNRATFTPATGPTTAYSWDPLGRLTSTTQTSTTTGIGPAPAFRAKSEAPASATAPAATTLIVDRPVGTQTGDLLIAAVVNAGTTSGGVPATITSPSGWTLAKPSIVSGGVQTTVYTRVATAGDPANWTFTFSASVKSAGSITAYSGTATTAIDASASQANASSTTATAPSVTTTGINRTLVTIAGFSTNTASSVASPMTERVDKAASPSAPTVALEIADRTLANVGATGTTTITAVTAAKSATVTLALTPANTTGTTSQTTTNIYDIDRQRILRKDPDGTVTLYLAGLMELRKPPGAAPEATTTYYNITGATVAVRNPGTLDWLLGDEHGSASTTIDATAGTVRRQYYSPYGNNRATTTNGTTGGNLPTNHAYLGQTRDNSLQLSYLNNRHLDSSTGTFLTVDPLVGKTGQAYLYGGGNPTTFSDPSGLEPGSWNNTSREYWVWQFFWKLNTAQLMAARERIAAACQGGCSQPPSKDFVNVGGRQYQVFDSPEEVEHEYLDDTRELLERRLAGQDTGLGRAPGGKASESFGLISDGAAVVALGCLGFWWLAGSGLACAGAAGTVSAAAGAAEAVALWVEDDPAKECKTAVAVVSAILPAPGSAERPLVEATFGVTRGLTGLAAGQAC